MMLRHHKSETAQNKFPKFETKFQVLKLNQFFVFKYTLTSVVQDLLHCFDTQGTASAKKAKRKNPNVAS